MPCSELMSITLSVCEPRMALRAQTGEDVFKCAYEMTGKHGKRFHRISSVNRQNTRLYWETTWTNKHSLDKANRAQCKPVVPRVKPDTARKPVGWISFG